MVTAVTSITRKKEPRVVRLTPAVISLGVGNWYEEGEDEAVVCNVMAELLNGATPIAISDVTCSASFEGMTYTVSLSNDKLSANIAFSIDPTHINQQVGNSEEGDFIEVALTGPDGTIVKGTVTIAENRRGDDGEDAEDAVTAVLSKSSDIIVCDFNNEQKESFDLTVKIWVKRGNTSVKPSSIGIDNAVIGGKGPSFTYSNADMCYTIKWTLIKGTVHTANYSPDIITRYGSAVNHSVFSVSVVREGKSGLNGCVVRPCGKWDSNTVYVNESNEDITDRVRYIDVVQYVYDNKLYYYMRTARTDGYQKGVIPTNTNYWERANMQDFIATNLLMADAAWVEFFTGKSAYFTDNNGNITAGMQGNVTDEPQIFVGASKDDAMNAPCRVFKDGSLYASKANIEGEVRARSIHTLCVAIPATINHLGEGLTDYLSLNELDNGEYTDEYGNMIDSAGARHFVLEGQKTITLNSDAKWVSQRIIIINKEKSAGGNHNTTTVVAEDNNIIYGVGAPKKTSSTVPDLLWNWDDATQIEFCNGVIELLAFSNSYGGVDWMVTNLNAAGKMINGELV